MLEITYLVLAKDSDILAIQNEPVTSYTFEGRDNGDIELHVPVETDTLELLHRYLTAAQKGAIKHNNVALIRFYT